MKTEEVAATAYQVIGALAEYVGLFDDSNVIKALDYFSDIANGTPGERVKGDLLPWCPESISSPVHIEELETALFWALHKEAISAEILDKYLPVWESVVENFIKKEKTT